MLSWKVAGQSILSFANVVLDLKSHFFHKVPKLWYLCRNFRYSSTLYRCNIFKSTLNDDSSKSSRTIRSALKLHPWRRICNQPIKLLQYIKRVLTAKVNYVFVGGVNNFLNLLVYLNHKIIPGKVENVHKLTRSLICFTRH